MVLLSGICDLCWVISLGVPLHIPSINHSELHNDNYATALSNGTTTYACVLLPEKERGQEANCRNRMGGANLGRDAAVACRGSINDVSGPSVQTTGPLPRHYLSRVATRPRASPEARRRHAQVDGHVPRKSLYS